MKIESAELARLGQWVKVPVARPDHLNLIPRIQGRKRTDSYKLFSDLLMDVW